MDVPTVIKDELSFVNAACPGRPSHLGVRTIILTSLFEIEAIDSILSTGQDTNVEVEVLLR